MVAMDSGSGRGTSAQERSQLMVNTGSSKGRGPGGSLETLQRQVVEKFQALDVGKEQARAVIWRD